MEDPLGGGGSLKATRLVPGIDGGGGGGGGIVSPSPPEGSGGVFNGISEGFSFPDFINCFDFYNI